VVFVIGGHKVGSTTSTATGAYRGPLDVSGLPVGSYQVTAECGLLLTSAPLELVLASEVSNDASTLIIIIFFILFGMAILSRQLRIR
jgi:hypothetical protein